MALQMNCLPGMNVAWGLQADYGRLASITEQLVPEARTDSPVAVSVHNQLTADIVLLKQEIRDTSDEISTYQAADAALSTISERLDRMRQLVEQASWESYTEDQIAEMDAEYLRDAQDIDDILADTEHDDTCLFNGDESLAHFDFSSVTAIDLTPPPAGALAAIDSAAADVSTARAVFSVHTNQLQSTITSLEDQVDKLYGLDSRIDTVDMAYQVATKAATTIMVLVNPSLNAQANVPTWVTIELTG